MGMLYFVVVVSNMNHITINCHVCIYMAGINTKSIYICTPS